MGKKKREKINGHRKHDLESHFFLKKKAVFVGEVERYKKMGGKLC